MHLLWIVFRYEFLRQGQRRAYLLMTFGLPVIGILFLTGYQLVNTTAKENNNDNTVVSFKSYRPVGYVGDALPPPQGPPFEGKVIHYSSESEAQTALARGTIDAYYLLADDYLASGDVEMVMEDFTLEVGEQANLFEAFVLSFLLDSHNELYTRLQNPVNITTHRVTVDGDTETRNEDTDFWLVYVFSMALFFSTITASGYLMQSVIEERETRMIEIIISSIRPTQLLVGKILAMGLLGFLQIGLWLGTLTWILTQIAEDAIDLEQLEVSGSTVSISLLYFLGGYALLGAGFAAIGALSNNMREGPQLATFLTLPAITPIWFTSLIVRDPHGTTAVVFSMIPFTAPITMVMRATLDTVPPFELVLSLSLLFISIVAMMWVAGRLFRISSLLADTTPRLRDLPRLLFG